MSPSANGTCLLAASILTATGVWSRGVSFTTMATWPFRLDAQEAADLLAQVASAVGHWRTTATSHGLSPAEIEQMEPAFEHAEREQADSIVRGHRS
jgi:hypothetical protein